MQLQQDEILTPINDGLVLIEKKDGLTFGTDALLLAAFVRRQSRFTAADFGSGTGVISLLCAARNKFAHIHAIEIQPQYAALIGRNAAQNGLTDRITPHCADVRDWNGGQLDAVFSNPPYMVKSGLAAKNEGRQIARHEMHGTLADFCAAAGRVLRYGGLFYTVCRPDRTADLFCAMRQYGLEPKRTVWVYRDPDHAPALILTEAKKGARAALRVERPLFLYRDGQVSADYRYILENGDFAEWK